MLIVSGCVCYGSYLAGTSFKGELFVRVRNGAGDGDRGGKEAKEVCVGNHFEKLVFKDKVLVKLLGGLLESVRC